MKSSESLLKAIDAIVYGDAFNCAVSFEEVHEYSRIRAEESDLRELLQKLVSVKLIEQSDSYYHLPGRRELAKERPQSIDLAVRLQHRASRVGRWLRHLPFIREIYLTGSVAADNAEPDADVDLLIVVSAGRPGMVFALLGPLSRLLSRQVFCPNYYISEDSLQLDRHSHYVAREVVQACPLMGDSNHLLTANQWVREQLPNFQAFKSGAGIPRGSRIQQALEFLLQGKLGDRLEHMARRLALKRLEAHYQKHDNSIPERIRGQFERGEAFRFHAHQKVQSAESEHQEKCVALLRALAPLADGEEGDRAL